MLIRLIDSGLITFISQKEISVIMKKVRTSASCTLFFVGSRF